MKPFHSSDRGSTPHSFRDRQSKLSRRHMLQVGMLGLGGLGLSLPELLAAEALQSDSRPAADACILIFLDGGPSHLDMWDMKPDAPAGIRGEFNPIGTSLPGYFMSEHLPRLAQHAHRGTIVRSMHHSVNNSHGAAVYTSLTGHDRGEVGGAASPNDYPCLGAVLQKYRPTTADTLTQVHLPYIVKEGAGGPPQPGFFGGILGRSYDPLFVLKDPNAPDFGVPDLTVQPDVAGARLQQRRQLFEALDPLPVRERGPLVAGEMTRMQTRAMDLLTSERTQRAFRLSEESPTVREAYGRNIYGQSTLLARRLIEAGTRMVTVAWAPDANATWDTHGSNFASLRGRLLPQLDAAGSSLIQDLADRGMLDRTLVAIFGDFGRTPKINANNAGRDHWNFCYSLMLVGGGFKQGLVYGSSDKIGAYPASNALVPGDILSTIYHLLGMQHDSEIRDQLNRPLRLVPSGDVVGELLA
ncbi:MAG: DUF1501 domain-containing protein [Planctomycetales bacterium]